MAEINLGKMSIPVIVPIKGVDYFTSEEKEEMEQAVYEKVNQKVEEAENIRQNNEIERSNNEELRQNTEQERKTNELERNSNEDIRIESENVRKANEEARKLSEEERNNAFNEKMQKCENTISEIKDMTEKYNTNAEEKTKIFDNNVNNQISDFNTNANSKMTTFNENVQSKLDDFNNNAQVKTAEFNKAKEDTENKLTEFNNNIEAKTSEFNENAKNKTEEFNTNAESYSKRITSNEAKITELETENAELKKDIEAVSLLGEAEGESIALKDSSGARFKKIELSGNSKQETREGYNNLDTSKLTTTESSGITAIYQESGKIRLNGTSSGIANFYIKNLNKTLKAGTYTVKTNLTSTELNGIIFKDVNNVSILPGAANLKTATIENDVVLSYVLIQIRNGITLNDFDLEIMLYQGNENKEYEPYGAMPSLDYPSEIEAVGNNSIKKEYLVIGYVRTAGDFSQYTDKEEMRSDYIKVSSGETFEFEILETLSNYGNWFGVGLYDKDKTFIKRLTQTTADLNKFTFTIPENVEYMVVSAANLIQATKISLKKVLDGHVGNINLVKCNKNRIDILDIRNWKMTGWGGSTGEVSIADKTIVCKLNQQIDASVWNNYYIKIPKIFLSKPLSISFEAKIVGKSKIHGTNVWFKNNHTELKNNILKEMYNDLVENKFVKFTVENCQLSKEYLSFCFQSHGADDEPICLYIKNFQIEMNNVATEYVEHESEQITMPVQQPMLEGDYLDLENNEEIHTWNTIVFDGTQNYLKSTTYSDDKYLCAYLSRYQEDFSDSSTIKVENFQIGDYMKVLDKECMRNSGQFQIRILASRLSENSIAGLNEYFAAHNVKVYYKTKTPIRLPFTEQQKAAADKLNNLRTYKNGTNLYDTDEVSSNKNVVYCRDLETVINNINNAITVAGGDINV